MRIFEHILLMTRQNMPKRRAQIPIGTVSYKTLCQQEKSKQIRSFRPIPPSDFCYILLIFLYFHLNFCGFCVILIFKLYRYRAFFRKNAETPVLKPIQGFILYEYFNIYSPHCLTLPPRTRNPIVKRLHGENNVKNKIFIKLYSL